MLMLLMLLLMFLCVDVVDNVVVDVAVNVAVGDVYVVSFPKRSRASPGTCNCTSAFLNPFRKVRGLPVSFFGGVGVGGGWCFFITP